MDGEWHIEVTLDLPTGGRLAYEAFLPANLYGERVVAEHLVSAAEAVKSRLLTTHRFPVSPEPEQPE